jgi:proteasome lid subunit RPN8/RPN11
VFGTVGRPRFGRQLPACASKRATPGVLDRPDLPKNFWNLFSKRADLRVHVWCGYLGFRSLCSRTPGGFVTFTLEHHHWLRRRAADAAPLEVCGFVMSDGSIIEINNVHENPCDYFSMDLRQIRRKVDVRKIAAMWHTHPNGDVRPSEADLQAIRLCEWGYLIVTADEVALYEAQANSFWNAFV